MGLDLRFSCDTCGKVSDPAKAVTEWTACTTPFFDFKGSWRSHQTVSLPENWIAKGDQTYCEVCSDKIEDWWVCN